MKLTLRNSMFFIVIGFAVGFICALPMIIKQNDSFLVPGLIIMTPLLLIGLFGIIKVLFKKQ